MAGVRWNNAAHSAAIAPTDARFRGPAGVGEAVPAGGGQEKRYPLKSAKLKVCTHWRCLTWLTCVHSNKRAEVRCLTGSIIKGTSVSLPL